MKMPKLIPAYLLAPCGMNCMVCYVHLKDKKPCDGCLGDDARKPERCRSCAIKDCARGKGLAYCHECCDFPCKRIKSLDKSYRERYAASLVENGATLRAGGIEAFQESERRRWSCGACGGVISLHDGKCSECGEGALP
jgi:hypothetical protein